MPKAWRLPVFLSGLILLSQAFPLMSPVRNAATGEWVSGFSLQLPTAYLIFAPFCGIATRITLLSFHQALVFLTYLFLTFLWFTKPLKIALAWAVFIVFFVWIAAVPHPAARLVAADKDVILVDFHSHSRVSHDGRPSFDAAANIRWHAVQGYNAGFITDHNQTETTQKAKELTRQSWQTAGYRALEGEEISLWKTHLVVLGNHQRIDNQPFDSDPARVRVFIGEMNRRKLPVISSLPEYWIYHWDGSPIGTMQDFVNWGINGFEIVNSAPKALDFPPHYRRQIVEICRANNLFMTGISDTHGYGYSTSVWNAMRIPGWQTMDPDALEAAVIKTLNTERFRAVEVLEFARYNPATLAGLLVAPLLDAGIYWRSLQLFEVLSWLVWIWLSHILWSIFRTRRLTDG